MLTVHHLNNSRSQRVLWLLEELGVPYDVTRYERDSKTMLAPAALRAVHPLGKSPVVVTDEGETFAESGAILEALVERHPQSALAPAQGTAERDRYRYWMHYAEGSAMPPLVLKLVFGRIRSAPAPFFVRPILRGIADRVMKEFVTPQLELHVDWMERELGRFEWFAGNAFTAADIQMSFPVEAAASRAGAGSRPKLAAFIQRIHARPAYQRALQRGGPFDLGA